MKKVIPGILVGLLVAASALAKPTPAKPAKPSASASAKPDAAAAGKSGSSKNLGSRDWAAIHDIVTSGSKMYIASGLTLLAADATGNATDLYPNGAPDWGSAQQLTAFEGKLYAMCDDAIYEVDPKDGKNVKLGGGGYRYVGGMAGLSGKLYVASEDALFAVDKKTGKHSKFTTHDWYNVHGVVALDDTLYIISNNALWTVDATAKVTQLPGAYPNVNGLTAANGKVYVFTNDPSPVIHQVDKAGKDTVLPLPTGWDGSTGINGMTVLNNKLYLIEPNMGSSITLFTIDVK